MAEKDDQETQRRLQRILEGAFSGSPTTLKDIPTRFGKPRAKKKPQRKRSRQRKRHAA